MDETSASAAIDRAVAELRRVGAVFVYLHGSRANGSQRADSDVDLAVYFGAPAPQSFEVLMPPGVDLLVLDHAPLELAGRVALAGRLLVDDDPARRIRWEATTRKIYSDELPRIRRSHAEFAESVRRG